MSAMHPVVYHPAWWVCVIVIGLVWAGVVWAILRGVTNTKGD